MNVNTNPISSKSRVGVFNVQKRQFERVPMRGEPRFGVGEGAYPRWVAKTCITDQFDVGDVRYRIGRTMDKIGLWRLDLGSLQWNHSVLDFGDNNFVNHHHRITGDAAFFVTGWVDDKKSHRHINALKCAYLKVPSLKFLSCAQFSKKAPKEFCVQWTEKALLSKSAKFIHEFYMNANNNLRAVLEDLDRGFNVYQDDEFDMNQEGMEQMNEINPEEPMHVVDVQAPIPPAVFVESKRNKNLLAYDGFTFWWHRNYKEKSYSPGVIGSMTYLEVEGQFVCDKDRDNKLQEIEVKLCDEDYQVLGGAREDTEMGKTKPGLLGHFYVSGYAADVTSEIDPYLRVKHSCCAYGLAECYMEVKMPVDWKTIGTQVAMFRKTFFYFLEAPYLTDPTHFFSSFRIVKRESTYAHVDASNSQVRIVKRESTYAHVDASNPQVSVLLCVAETKSLPDMYPLSDAILTPVKLLRQGV
uniref:Uncharacterized protein n=1 Tax=Ditylenchus dipsaci TaxID=166011 RepID=A0A915ETB0_9BILA